MYFSLINAGIAAYGAAASAKANNKAVEAYNSAQMAALGRSWNQISLEMAAKTQQTNAALFNLQAKEQQAQAQVQLQASAAGVMGASVKDAKATVSNVFDRQEAGVRASFETAKESAYQQTLAAGYNTAANLQGKQSVAGAVAGSVANSSMQYLQQWAEKRATVGGQGVYKGKGQGDTGSELDKTLSKYLGL